MCGRLWFMACNIGVHDSFDVSPNDTASRRAGCGARARPHMTFIPRHGVATRLGRLGMASPLCGVRRTRGCPKGGAAGWHRGNEATARRSRRSLPGEVIVGGRIADSAVCVKEICAPADAGRECSRPPAAHGDPRFWKRYKDEVTKGRGVCMKSTTM